tara:strand:- start:950 stop:1258 length:309 start_codon:yes stop_codon:yes gene_type:complete
MNNKIIERDNDWDQFVIIDYEPKSRKYKFKKTNIQDPIKENVSEEKNKIKKIPSNFSINDVINKNEGNSHSYLDLFVNTSAVLIKKMLFSICYISIKYMYTI